MANSYGTTIAEFAKSASTVLHVKKGTEYKGRKYVSLVDYISCPRYTGWGKPVNVPIENVGEVVAAMLKAAQP